MARSTKICLLLLLIVSAFQARNLQATIYEVIVIGAGAAGVGASLTLKAKGINHIILEARSRFGGRTTATTVSEVNVDLGASFVHNPETNHSISSYVKTLNWPTTLASFSSADVVYQAGKGVSQAEETAAQDLLKLFKKNVYNQVSNGVDIDLQTAWNNFKAANATTSSEAVVSRAYFDVLLEGILNGADINTFSTLAYASTSGKSSYDYLPGTSYAALIKAIFDTYCKNVTIMYSQVVKSIDYSGAVTKITTSDGTVYYANKVINTIPLGCLKNGDVTFIPQLPNAYKTAISSIGMGVFNKVVVTLNDTFWENDTSTRIVDLAFPPNTTTDFPEFYVSPTNPKLLLFFISGNRSATLSNKTDSQILSELQSTVNLYAAAAGKAVSVNTTAGGYAITRWEQEAYSRGSYSYYKVNTTQAHFQTLSTPIDQKLWFAGQHVPPKYSSNVHGAFQSGITAGALAGAWQLVTLLGLLLWALA